MIEYYSKTQNIVRWIDRLRTLVAIAAMVSLLAQYGFYLSDRWEALLTRVDLLIIVFYVLQYLVKISLAISKVKFLKRFWFETLLVLLIVLDTATIIRTLGYNVIREVFLNIDVTAVMKVYIAAAQVLIFFTILAEVARHNRKFTHLKFHPSQTLILSFLLVIAFGTVLLLLPRATHPGMELDLLDALFTATSATCVTGLIVVDTGSTFSLFGQLVILFMIQIGGLGIMTITSFFALLFGAGVGLRERVILNDVLNVDKLGTIVSILRNVVIITFSLELVGAVLLLLFWELPDMPLRDQVYFAVFHSISAFCNAGFSLFKDSLIGYRHNVMINSIFMTLIILGGLGFTVLMDLGAAKLLRNSRHRKINRFTIQTKIVTGVSLLLLLGGTVLLYIFEMGKMDWLTALFSSVTARTAGFNTIDVNVMSTTSLLLIMALMFIGASPGSTGGGVKTTTLAVLIFGTISIIRGKSRIEYGNRTIPFTVINRAIVVIFFSLTFVVLAAILLSFTEDAPLRDILFETVSAFGTVGLSTGLTPHLSPAGKAIIIAAMFFGRLGAVTLAFAITQPGTAPRIEYPSENVMVG